jgi:hypothetical protein
VRRRTCVRGTRCRAAAASRDAALPLRRARWVVPTTRVCLAPLCLRCCNRHAGDHLTMRTHQVMGTNCARIDAHVQKRSFAS